jgi:hypothetical protein
MSQQIDTALVQSYRSNIEIQFQQKQSRLERTVIKETQHSERDFYDRIGPVEARKNDTRHGDTEYDETPHTRRAVTLDDYFWADLIDNKDKLRMLADPTSSYVQNGVNALNRAKDRVIITSMFGTAYSGKTGATANTFAAASEVAVNYVEAGAVTNSNLTIAKLRRAKFILTASEAVDDGEELFAAVTTSQLDSLLRTTEVTSADYNSVKALVNGTVDQFMGFKFIRTELMPKTAAIRECAFYPRSAVTFASAEELVIKVDELPTKHYNVQVYVRGNYGAVRMWEEKVVRVKCDET